MSASPRGALVWFRRDLRDFDHAALAAAAEHGGPVYAAFVFDREILDPLPSRRDRRVEFIHASVEALDAALRARSSGLIVEYAHAREAIPRLARTLGVDTVFANHDYEPDAIARDAAIGAELAAAGIALRTSKDQVVFERNEILNRSGQPFAVFTPYRNAWLARLTPGALAPHDADHVDLRPPPEPLDRGVPPLAALGFATTNLSELPMPPGMAGGTALFADFRKRIDRYHQMRDFPALRGPSYLSVHLRFGTVSIRRLVAHAHSRSLEAGGQGAATWLSELIWREFYAMILWHHPRVVDHAFRPEYDRIEWPNDSAKLAAWREGRTGYPIVDAAMRQINATGYMHNRLRMVAASFLVKDLHVDWRVGERYFAQTLNDYDLASNNGGWQWSASTGCDAQPYFRIFNPVSQSQRFDPQGAFIRHFVPELAKLRDDEIHAPWKLPQALQRERGVVIGRDYPAPIVDHALARRKTLELFKARR